MPSWGPGCPAAVAADRARPRSRRRWGPYSIERMPSWRGRVRVADARFGRAPCAVRCPHPRRRSRTLSTGRRRRRRVAPVTPHRWHRARHAGRREASWRRDSPRRSRRPATSTSPDSPAAGRNEVALTGRLAAEAEERELPSGDRIATLRVVVPREPAAGRRRAAADEPQAGDGRHHRRRVLDGRHAPHRDAPAQR